RNYSWPGNIRELQSVLQQAILRSTGPVLLPAFLPELSAASAESGASLPSEAAFDLDAIIRQRLRPEAENLYEDIHREVDRLFLMRMLEYTGGNKNHAAQLLGISRQTLRLKLNDVGLQVTQSVAVNEE